MTTPGLEGMPRMDMGALEESLPSLVERAVGGPVVLTRNGSDAFVLLPLDAYGRLWAQAPRPPVIDATSENGAPEDVSSAAASLPAPRS